MCLLIAVKKGVSKSSDLLTDAIKKASTTNRDGIGFGYKRHKSNKIYISKGFSDVDEVLEILTKKNLKLEDELIIHLRIGNKGAKTKAMTHPFVISDDDDVVLSNNKFVENPIMAHNGTLYDFGDYNGPTSDTYCFARDFMSVPEIQDLLKRDKDLFVATFKFTLKLNRMAFLFPDNTPLITLGEFIEDEGYLFSNDSYKKAVYNVGGVTHTNSCQCTNCKTRRMNVYMQGWEGDGDGDYDSREAKPKTNLLNSFSSPFHNNQSIHPTAEQLRLEDIVRNGGHFKSIGERKRDSDGLLMYDPKIDITPPTTIGNNNYVSIHNLPNKITLYPIAGNVLYTPVRYVSNQFNSTIFIPKIFNYKHFTYYNPLGNDDRNINSREQYKIHEFDKDTTRVKFPVHLIGPLDYKPESIKGITDISWFTTPEIIRYFSSVFNSEHRLAYLTLYRLMQKYTVPSKNLCLQAQKAINGAIKKNNVSNDSSRLTNIMFKAVGNCTLTGLKLFYNYQAEFMYGAEVAKSMYYKVQDEDDSDKTVSLQAAFVALNAMS